MSLFNRQTLKNFFKKGKFPTEIHFAYLIDSTINKIDDGFAKTDDSGLQLSPSGESNTVLSVFDQVSDNKPMWEFGVEKNENHKGLNISSQEGGSQLYFKDDGKVGIQNTNPQHTLDVNGTIGYKSRMGTFKTGTVKSDGKWHSILTAKELGNMNAYEVVARVHKPHRIEKSSPAAAFIKAIAIHTHDKGNIQQTRVQYGFPAYFFRLCLRWKGRQDEFSLQIKSGWNYGEDEQGDGFPIEYHIAKLWE